jgi:hypothetical protein
MPISPSVAAAAASIGVDAPTLAAIVAVESSGAGLQAGRPVIRLEVHHFWRHTPAALRYQVDARYKVGGPEAWEGHAWRPTPGAAWEPLHVGQEREWRAYGLARAICAHAAIRATSWGLGQVLAGNRTDDERKDGWARCRFPSAEAFEAAQATEAGQLDTMARWLAGDPALLQAMRVKDWRTVARLYNGAGKVDDYAGRLAAAYHRAA